MNDIRPPRFAERLLRRLVRGEYGSDLAADLHHEFQERFRNGRLRAHIWYWTMVLSPSVYDLRRGTRRLTRHQWALGRSWRASMGDTPAALGADVRHSLRSLRASPRFALASVATLTLGIAVVTSLFTVVDAVLLRPLPFHEPDRLVVFVNDRSAIGGPRMLSTDQYALDRYDDQAQSYDAIEAQFAYPANIRTTGDPRSVITSRVTDGFLDVFGVRPELGRTLREGDREVAVISHALWQGYFDADPDIVGRLVDLEDVNPIRAAGAPGGAGSFTVVGVMPKAFRLPAWIDNPQWIAEMWIPLHPETAVPRPHVGVYQTVGRLRDGVTVEAAGAEMATIGAELARELPQYYDDTASDVVPIQREMVGDVRSTMWLLLASAGLLLLIVLTNTGNLFVTHGLMRSGAITVRRSLGATTYQVLRLVAVESAIVCGIAALLGVLAAIWMTPALVRLLPPETPRLGDVRVDLAVVWPACGIAFLASLIFGALGLVGSSGRAGALYDRLRAVGRTGVRHRGAERLQSASVAIQVALSVLLLFGAALTHLSMNNLLAIDPGFASENRLTFSLRLPQGRYPTPESKIEATTRINARIEALPGVIAAGGSDQIPPVRWNGVNTFEAEGRAEAMQAGLRTVTRHYPDAIGLRLVDGRMFDANDRLDSPRVLLLTEATAERLFPEGDALGKRLSMQGNDRWGSRTVVGIVRTMTTYMPGEPTIPEIYQPHEQDPWNQQRVVVHTAGDPLTLLGPVRRAVMDVDPMLPIERPRTLAQHVSRSLSAPRFLTVILRLFTFASLLLAGVGTVAVLSFAIAQRVREIAIRMAVGATRPQIVAHLLAQTLTVVVAGAVVGVAASLALGSILSSQLYGISPRDPLTLASTACAVMVVASLSALATTRGVARQNPGSVLRQD